MLVASLIAMRTSLLLTDCVGVLKSRPRYNTAKCKIRRVVVHEATYVLVASLIAMRTSLLPTDCMGVLK